jgi:hypothetical protein
VTRLADPKPDAGEKAYWTVLNKLRTEMARKLEQLAQASCTQAVVSPEPPRNGRKIVFLAETTQALMVDRDAVAAFLLDQGYDICPTRFYSRDPTVFARAMDNDLARAALFVQLLGEDCSIRNDVGNDPDQLPLMQHALMRTWLRAQERAAGSGQERLVVTREDYLAIGGLKEALSRHADEAYAELHTEAKQRVAEIMFRCLADEGPQKQIVRRIATVDEIRQVADTDLSTVIDVAQAFLRPDRSFLKTQRLENIWTDSTLDVSHEALLRHWGKVQKWLEGEAEAKHTFLRLAETAHLWESRQASVLRSPELDLALQWEARQKPTVAWAKRCEGDLLLCLKFLRASQAASTREKRLTRGIIAAAFIVISLFAAVGFLLWKQAKTSAEESRRQTKRALELSATSQHEEGKAWLKRALLHQEHRDFFTASMMAARAVGFDDYGRQSQNKGFAEAFPVLLQPHHPEYQEVQALLRSNSSAYQPIWQSPIARHHQDSVSIVAFSPDGRSLASGVGTTRSRCGMWPAGKRGPSSRAIRAQSSVWPLVRMGAAWPLGVGIRRSRCGM